VRVKDSEIEWSGAECSGAEQSRERERERERGSGEF
jgi:hypothetical protein